MTAVMKFKKARFQCFVVSQVNDTHLCQLFMAVYKFYYQQQITDDLQTVFFFSLDLHNFLIPL